MREFHLTLPFPVSVNAIWKPYRTKRGAGIRLSKEAREYLATAETVVRVYDLDPLECEVEMLFDVWMPDGKRRDISNLLKLLEDCLEGHLYKDDSQIRETRIRRHGVDPPGGVIVTARAIE